MDVRVECIYGDMDFIMIKVVFYIYDECLEDFVEDLVWWCEVVFNIVKWFVKEIMVFIGWYFFKIEFEKVGEWFMLFSKK